MKIQYSVEFCLLVAFASGAYLKVIQPGERVLPPNPADNSNVLLTKDGLLPVEINEEVDSIKLSNENFLKEKVKNGKSYRELIISSSGVIALQRVASHNEQTLKLLEITNGTLIVQLIFATEDKLIDCDATNTQRDIHKLAKHINSKLTQPDFLSVNKETPSLNVTMWIEQCAELHENELIQNLENQTNPVQYALEVNRNDRSKRSISDLIYPGTKWCGKGNSANHLYDLGEQRNTDICCRDHDRCNDYIPSLSYKYNYFNYGLLTISSCECDKKFKECLHKAKFWERDSIADMIEHIYFNVIKMSCFKIQPIRVCKQSSWWGRCTRYGHEMSAIFEVSTF